MPGDKDFDAVGIPSTSIINDILDNAEDPRQAISEFQEQNSLLVGLIPKTMLFLCLAAIVKACFEVIGASRRSTKRISWVGENLQNYSGQ